MMHPIEGLANETVAYISDQVKDNPEIDLKTTINGFALDSISKGLSMPLPNYLNRHNYRSNLPVFLIFRNFNQCNLLIHTLHG